MAIDSNGKAHISYYDIFAGGLNYVSNVSDSWVFEFIDIMGGQMEGEVTAIVVDSANLPHISYSSMDDEFNIDIKYAQKLADGSWNKVKIDDDWASAGNSIAIDSNNKAHISYHHISSPFCNIVKSPSYIYY